MQAAKQPRRAGEHPCSRSDQLAAVSDLQLICCCSQAWRAVSCLSSSQGCSMRWCSRACASQTCRGFVEPVLPHARWCWACPMRCCSAWRRCVLRCTCSLCNCLSQKSCSQTIAQGTSAPENTLLDIICLRRSWHLRAGPASSPLCPVATPLCWACQQGHEGQINELQNCHRRQLMQAGACRNSCCQLLAVAACQPYLCGWCLKLQSARHLGTCSTARRSVWR